MPQPAKILSLPADVRSTLDERLRTSRFSGFHDHAQWLLGLGHPVGKSALHVYAQRHRERIQAGRQPDSSDQADADDKATDQRIECLKIAAALTPGAARPTEVCDVAGKLYLWAKGR